MATMPNVQAGGSVNCFDVQCSICQRAAQGSTWHPHLPCTATPSNLSKLAGTERPLHKGKHGAYTLYTSFLPHQSIRSVLV